MQETSTSAQIEQLQRQWTQAELVADTTTLDSLLDRDFLGVGPLGFTLTKDAWIGRHQSGDLKYQALALDDSNVRQYGDSAIVVATQRQQATYQGNALPDGKFRVTLVLVRPHGEWQIAGAHLSPIAQPPASRNRP
jgi:ketosteroid isomerase-like protein